ncbi:molybdenum cofactor guanylyltransferase, partial [Streptomyces sp. NPDC127049]|uniref:molybdenum cofactor guanylyltransferase n=1 Tax=Streptomyces sp. NPDC127049 TaxID=3347118 RepID=UPI00364A3924
MTTAYDAVVLAGGAARRLGGVDKPGLRVGGRALLDRVLAACAGARLTVVVGDPRPTVRPVRWTRERPAGTGPVAALAAGAAALGTTGAGAAELHAPGEAVPGAPVAEAADAGTADAGTADAGALVVAAEAAATPQNAHNAQSHQDPQST